MIDFEFELQAWSGIAESLDAAGVAHGLPAADQMAGSRVREIAVVARRTSSGSTIHSYAPIEPG